MSNLIAFQRQFTKRSFSLLSNYSYQRLQPTIIGHSRRHIQVVPSLSLPSINKPRQWDRFNNDAEIQLNNDVEFCYSMLNKVSRSFAMVISQLPLDLKHSVCVFYLVLRALDTIEDDMDASANNIDYKLNLLSNFYTILDGYNTDWYQLGFTSKSKLNIHEWRINNGHGVNGGGNIDNNNNNGVNGHNGHNGSNNKNNNMSKQDATAQANTELLEKFTSVLNVFHNLLNDDSKQVIQEITKEMGFGMAKFGDANSKHGINGGIPQLSTNNGSNNGNANSNSNSQKIMLNTFEELDEYCYYVAGCVGLGLSQLFSSSNYVATQFAQQQKQNRYIQLICALIFICLILLLMFFDCLHACLFACLQLWLIL